MVTLIRFRTSIVYLNKIIIIVSTLVIFLFALFRYYTQAVFFYNGNFVLAFVYLIVFLMFGITYGYSRIGILRLGELVYSYCLSLIFTNIIIYFVISLICETLLNPIAILFMTMLQMLLGAVLYYFFNKIYFALHPSRDCVVIMSGSEQELKIVSKFKRMRDRYSINRVLNANSGYDALCAAIEPFSLVIVIYIDQELRAKLMAYCFEKDKQLFLMPSLQDIMLHNAHEIYIEDSPAYLCRNKRPTQEQLIVKRAMDIIVSVLSIVVFSPLMLLISTAIKLCDGGSVFYMQKRLTIHGHEFTLIKFRSMIEDAEKDGKARMAGENDVRITQVGKIIRAIHFDEFPQFINILLGNMSLVGPRPERPEIFEEYSKIFPEFHYRLKMKAGLTGYAQICGKYNTSFEDKVKMDLLYIERYSLLNDLRLLLATIKILFMKESAQGIPPEIIVSYKRKIFTEDML